MEFEKWVLEWYDIHFYAKSRVEKAKSSHDYTDIFDILIDQKLDWLRYCDENKIHVDKDFQDAFFDEIKEYFVSVGKKNKDWPLSYFLYFFQLITKKQAESYDRELLDFVNDLLKNAETFEELYNLYFRWIRMRITFLKSTKINFNPQEVFIMRAYYQLYREDFIKIRNTNFCTMWTMGKYFLRMYGYCKQVDRCAMAGDIVKIHDFVIDYMRDCLASAKMNGYYDQEGVIIQIIENLKAETETTPTVFISYNWANKEIAEQVEAAIKDKAHIRRDSHDIQSGDSLKQFMKSIRQQDFAILIVSDEYLESRNCMFEVLQLLKDYEEKEERFWNRIILFVTAKDIYSGEGREKRIKYWNDTCNRFENTLKDIPASACEGLAREARIFRNISTEIDKLLDHLNDEFCDRELETFIEHVRNKLDKWAQYGSNPYIDILMAAIEIGAIEV